MAYVAPLAAYVAAALVPPLGGLASLIARLAVPAITPTVTILTRRAQKESNTGRRSARRRGAKMRGNTREQANETSAPRSSPF